MRRVAITRCKITTTGNHPQACLSPVPTHDLPPLSFQVQSKPEKKPGTPPPAPTLATASPTPTPRSPSPPPAPVIVTPPPPAINIPRFYYPRGLPAMGPVTNHDAAIAAIEAAFAEFEEEKADIYEMGKIAKVSSCNMKHLMHKCCGWVCF